MGEVIRLDWVHLVEPKEIWIIQTGDNGPQAKFWCVTSDDGTIRTYGWTDQIQLAVPFDKETTQEDTPEQWINEMRFVWQGKGDETRDRDAAAVWKRVTVHSKYTVHAA